MVKMYDLNHNCYQVQCISDQVTDEYGYVERMEYKVIIDGECYETYDTCVRAQERFAEMVAQLGLSFFCNYDY